MPRGVTDVQLQQLANRMRISYFRGIFMRITLPIKGVHQNESGIVNLDSVERPSMHWVMYAKRGNRVIYFNSFGNFRPLKKFERYLANSVIEYNRTLYHRYN